MINKGKPEKLEGKPAPLPLSSPWTSYKVAQDWTQGYARRSQCLTLWVMAAPFNNHAVCNWNVHNHYSWYSTHKWRKLLFILPALCLFLAWQYVPPKPCSTFSGLHEDTSLITECISFCYIFFFNFQCIYFHILSHFLFHILSWVSSSASYRSHLSCCQFTNNFCFL
jgi:hypothetical protein